MSDALTDVLEAAGIPRPRPTRTVVERDGYRVVTPPPQTVEITIDLDKLNAAMKAMGDALAQVTAGFKALPDDLQAFIRSITGEYFRSRQVGRIIASQRRRRHR